MDKIEQLMSSHPEILFLGRHDCPKGFEATETVSQEGTIIMYNADLSFNDLYEAIQHEITHYERGDVAYSEKNEYQTEIETAMKFVDAEELFKFYKNNPELGDEYIAEHFNITLDQLQRCVHAYATKGIVIGNNQPINPDIPTNIVF